MEGGQLFCITEGKGPHKWTGYSHGRLFSLEFVAVLILIRPCRAMFGVIFHFLLGDGIFDWTSNNSALYFYEFIHTYDIAFLK